LSKALRLESKILKLSMPWIESGLFGENMLPEGYGNYIPGRNTIFLSIAASFAETIGASTVFIGANAGDADNYPDCRRDYLDGFNALLTMGTKKGGKGELRIERPFIDRDKSEIIRLGHSLGVPFQHTVSCYNGGVKPCMKCEACVKRRDGFKAAGIDDPLVVRHTEFTVSV
jgi:7-cyano-7-deazaguanine synthase